MLSGLLALWAKDIEVVRTFESRKEIHSVTLQRFFTHVKYDSNKSSIEQYFLMHKVKFVYEPSGPSGRRLTLVSLA